MTLPQATIGFHLAIDSNFNRCLLIDKPSGITTFDIIRKLRKYIDKSIKIGHCGTLDPFASGLVIILTGQYTKLQAYIQHAQKRYLGKIELGYETDTLDIEGKKIQFSNTSIPDSIDIKKIENYILSLQEQIPPKYSAIKLNGTPMYKLARKNIPFTPKKRKIEIFSFSITSYKKPFISFDITVSGGTYIRSIAKSIGDIISIPATIVELRRTSINDISIDKAIILDKIYDKNSISEHSENIASILQLPCFSIDDDMLNKIRNGRDISLNNCKLQTEKLLLKYDNTIVAIGKYVGNSTVHPEKVMV